ncbi:GHKL domain-containing protein [Ligilactobacillus aviarius]|uniref:ATPase n=2 Tax=Ligilactobacillus aviarius TaxID=1606 RepID=A0A510WTE9_9LACO|nr:ATPase [Ligilactobacillus aviarius]
MLQFLSFFIEPLHIICFYILFCTQNWQYIREARSNKFIKLAISVIILVVIQVVIELGLIPIPWLFFLCTNVVTILFLIVITYLCLRRHANSDLTLRINVLLSMDIFIAIQIFCAFLDKSLMVICRNITVVHPMLVVVIIHNIIEAALSFFMGIISARLYKLNRIIDKKVDRQVHRIVVVMFIIMYALTLIFTVMQKLYDHVENLLIFLIIQLIFFWILYFSINRREKQRIHNELVENRLSNLKEYTDHLEQEQRKLRKFKHDYQNMLLSLEENLRSSDSQDAKDYLQTFKQYSDNYISESGLWMFNDFDNVKTPYLKSILINKTSQATEQGIDVHFECRYDVDQIAMEPYDLVRIVGIAYDNAIEAVRNLDKNHRKINVMVYRTKGQTEVTIANPMQTAENLTHLKKEGVTTKKGHSGLGLANIEEISANYSNVLVNYREVKGWFTIQFTIMDK